MIESLHTFRYLCDGCAISAQRLQTAPDPLPQGWECVGSQHLCGPCYKKQRKGACPPVAEGRGRRPLSDEECVALADRVVAADGSTISASTRPPWIAVVRIIAGELNRRDLADALPEKLPPAIVVAAVRAWNATPGVASAIEEIWRAIRPLLIGGAK